MTAGPARPPSEPAAARGRLLVLSGPSGVGKTAVADRLLADPRVARAITATTRAPRPGERDGVDYLFLAVDEFRRRLADGWFLEHADVYGRLYGTPRSSVEAVLASGRHCLLVIDVQGVATLRAAGAEATFVLLEPPSRAELERRLKTRGSDDPASQARRLEEAERELARTELFDRRVVNADLETAAREVAATVGLDLAPPR
ncbi:MAG: guanylate kinase [Planctomycetia bacterium]|nr:guanylate kinase [Planctomycetia bacterium]